MRLKHVFAAVVLLSTSAIAEEEDLKPAQEEAKASFEEDIKGALKAANDKCGTKLTVTSDFKNFKSEEWSGTSFSSYCEGALQGIEAMCERPAYKKAISKKVTSVACLFSGVKPTQKDDGSNGATLRNMSLEKGVFTYHLGKDHANITDNAKATLEKAFN
ncbi:hypothetical protein [Corallococcus llansteffanensis]|uniref:Uncharacterized protein n=1 Tax=Corallococcus llansteffanensis TaxID=2316731 RepID=A0A3A8QDF0_9BACT|nr:hypothetical protein [Corallococcus llansteffanensis]RKH66148.1 hypothetical protein D7V93_04775 [Corallococcus llansteffanensis]